MATERMHQRGSARCVNRRPNQVQNEQAPYQTQPRRKSLAANQTTTTPKVAVANMPAVLGGGAPVKKGIPPCPARKGTTFYLTGKIMGSVSKAGWRVFPDWVSEQLVKFNGDHEAAWVAACEIIRAHGR
ncbi:hypothetical protein N9L68_02815 [bacterium]|nr:hypothetical protein [bacterium]